MAHRNIPIFIPHLGCPNQCVFCNQRSISGCSAFQRENVIQQIEQALSTIPDGTDTEIAFFGGSFTGIDRELMIWLLETAGRYVSRGRVSSIRLSTRPDYITPEILKILSGYPVKTVELGLQSMDDEVLKRTARGHTAKAAREACRAVVDAGFSLVGQMMIGLPASTPQKELATAREICNLGASAARIYPTVVFYDTPLQKQMAEGSYQPLTVEQAIDRTADVLEVFLQNNVPCIRIGLCASEDLVSPERVAAGPNHPALGELVWNRYYYKKIIRTLTDRGLLGREVLLLVPENELSKAIGQRRCNIEKLLRETDTRVYQIVGDTMQTEVLPIERQSAEKLLKRSKRTCI
jgi:histone acetyltransferase (RNA polymerase elongator complex component)